MNDLIFQAVTEAFIGISHHWREICSSPVQLFFLSFYDTTPFQTKSLGIEARRRWTSIFTSAPLSKDGSMGNNAAITIRLKLTTMSGNQKLVGGRQEV
jgi:hypothetical protein